LIFVDSNVVMYLVGAAHPNKEAARRVLRRAIEDDERLVTSVEVLQEILHRYVAIGRRDAIDPALDALLSLVDEVLGLDVDDVLRAREILKQVASLSARDALHVAVMERYAVRQIMSFDAGFDDWRGIERLG
jgi:uncharacterized protein